MSIVLVGASHKSASLEVREQLSAGIVSKGLRFSDSDFLHGWMLLDTCNRVELYASVDEANPQVADFLETQLRTISGLDHYAFQSVFYQKADDAAVDHLFRVASSLDSLVLGENEILGQVKQAWQSQRHFVTDSALDRLFQHALQTGKRVRHETGISRHPVSVASVAVSFVEQAMDQFGQRCVLLLGAGEMGAQVAQRFHDRQIKKLSIMSLRGERALQLAAKLDASVVFPSQLSQALAQADVVIAATASPDFVIQPDQMGEREKPLLLLDLAVPRDIDPVIGLLPGVRLFNIDHLQSVVTMHRQRREQEVPKAERIIHQETQNFMDWLSTRKTPVVVYGD